MEVDSRNVTAGGVITAKLPQFFKKARRSFSGRSWSSGFTGPLLHES
jgi:hypothetical protein